ncbi:MAG: MerR family transcriptional regulator [Candidatus Microsaccharimonas sp.]
MSTQPKVMQTFTIKEASEQCGLPESTLRYYESIGIIDPVARDSSSKHRVYSEDDINALDAIACLNATGMPLEDMRAYMENRTHGTNTAGEQIALFNTHLERLRVEAQFLKLREAYVQLKLSYWQAVEAGNESLADTIGQQAKALAQDLKFSQK